jgi:uncharacterized protein (TIGR00297 family)
MLILGDRILDSVGLSTYFFLLLSANVLFGAYTYRRRSLTLAGSVSATVLGAVIFATTGLYGWLLLLTFFFTSTFLTRVSRRFSKGPDGIVKKGGCRDAMQVFANGGPSGIAALMFSITENHLFLIMFGAALAESAADTWASEVGVMSSRPPVLITTFKPVVPGLSGGVSILGTSAGLIGSFLIGWVWWISFEKGDNNANLSAFLVALAGFVGSIIDSILGATVQAHYWDPERNQLTENEVRNGQRLALVRGIRFVDNDIVNLTSNVATLALIYLVMGD